MSHVVTESLWKLAQVAPSATPVLSVYVGTRASDEHQRGLVRVFLKSECRRVEAMAVGALAAELAWITAQGERIVNQELYPDAEAIALFAGGSPALRETIPLAVAVEDRLLVGAAPRLRPLVEALAATPRTLVVFVDGESARLITVTEAGGTDEIVLAHPDVVGHHRRGGWGLLLQSKYDKHVRVHRDRHFEAVAEALAATVARHGITAVVLAGESRNRAVFQPHVPAAVAKAIVGEIAAAQYEPASALAERALAAIRLEAGSAQAGAVDGVLVEAGAGGRAAAGVEATLDAVNGGTVERLYLLDAFTEAGGICTACAALQRAGTRGCRWCGKPTMATDLGEEMVRRVIVAGGGVESLRVHSGLAAAGGAAALLRFRPRGGRRP